jgi:hypothetical protein
MEEGTLVLHSSGKGLMFYLDFSTYICKEEMAKCSEEFYEMDYRLYL